MTTHINKLRGVLLVFCSLALGRLCEFTDIQQEVHWVEVEKYMPVL